MKGYVRAFDKRRHFQGGKSVTGNNDDKERHLADPSGRNPDRNPIDSDHVQPPTWPCTTARYCWTCIWVSDGDYTPCVMRINSRTLRPRGANDFAIATCVHICILDNIQVRRARAMKSPLSSSFRLDGSSLFDDLG